MTFMTMDVTSVSMTLEPQFSEANGRRGHSMYMGVHPQDHAYLELKTGQIFCNPRYANLRGRKGKHEMISASLSIRPALSDEDYRRNTMRYFPEAGSDFEYQPSTIYFQCYLPPDDFQNILTNLRSGLVPSAVTVDLNDIYDQGSILQFGREPDGSGMKWNNDKAASGQREVKIEGLTINYDLFESHGDDDAQTMTRRDRSVIEAVDAQSKQLAKQLNSIREAMYYGRLLIIVLVAIAVLALWFIQQHTK
jgi:hypothetical protein